MNNKKSVILVVLILVSIIAVIVIILFFRNNNDENIMDLDIYDINNELVDINEDKDIEVEYNYTYGEIFKIENNTIYYGDVKEEDGYLSQSIQENSKIINYESEKTIDVNNVNVGDYVTFYAPTEETQNAQSIIIVTKKDYIINQIQNKLLNGKEFQAELYYYDETEKYITVEIALNSKVIEEKFVQPIYYLDLNVGDATETYLGGKENNPDSSYGYHVHELCTIELESEITDLSNKYMVKSIKFIAD